jgi:glycosyltransferase involved in cell wall biosynthesis
MMLWKLLRRMSPGFAPVVVSLIHEGTLSPRFRQLGIPVYHMDMRVSPMSVLVGFFRLVRLIRRERPEVVQTWMYHADLIGGVAARMAGVRRVYWGLRNSSLSRKLTPRSTFLTLKACAWLSRLVPTRIISNSHVSVKIHICEGYAEDKFLVIPNGFDVAQFRPADAAEIAVVRAMLGIPMDARVIGMVARKDPQKNQASFVRLVARLRSEGVRVIGLMIGGGVDTSFTSLVAQIRANGCEDVILLLGRRDDVARLMPVLEIMVLPSLFGEAFPNVLGEAMASNVPCVAADVGDARIILGDSGLVVPPGDDDALHDAVVRLLDMPAAERGEWVVRGRARVINYFEISAVTQLFEAVYAGACER